MILYGALTRGLVWPNVLMSAAALLLSVCSNFLLATTQPALYDFYFMDRFHFWPVLFGCFLAHAIVEARRRRKADGQEKINQKRAGRNKPQTARICLFMVRRRWVPKSCGMPVKSRHI